MSLIFITILQTTTCRPKFNVICSDPQSLCFDHRKGKKKRDRSPSSSSSSSSPSPYPPPFRGKEFIGEGMEHSEEGYGHPRYPPRDYSGPTDRGPRDYEGHNPERGRGRGFVSSCLCFDHLLCCVCLIVTEVLTARLLCPDGITALCSVPPNARQHNVDDNDDTVIHIPFTAWFIWR